MVGHGGSSAGSYLADPTSPIPSHCASIVVTSTVRVNGYILSSGVWKGFKGGCVRRTLMTVQMNHVRMGVPVSMVSTLSIVHALMVRYVLF